MNKDTIELVRFPKHVVGYELMQSPVEISEIAQLNKIVEWAQHPMGAKGKVYKHILRREEENVGGVYKYFSYGCEIDKERYERYKDSEMGRAYACYYCDLVYYLDIYWQ